MEIEKQDWVIKNEFRKRLTKIKKRKATKRICNCSAT
jgi:hypothetical protein